MNTLTNNDIRLIRNKILSHFNNSTDDGYVDVDLELEISKFRTLQINLTGEVTDMRSISHTDDSGNCEKIGGYDAALEVSMTAYVNDQEWDISADLIKGEFGGNIKLN